MTTNNAHGRYEILLVKAVDGQLSPAERTDFEDHVRSCEICRAEYEDFVRIKEATDMVTERILRDADIEPPREAGPTRAILGLAFVLVFAGLLILLGFGVYALVTDPTVPAAVKVGGCTAGLGALILLVYVVRIRVRGLSRDPYREIDR